MTMRIGDRVLGDGHPCYVIAEIGINHNGDIEIARRLIDVAAKAGCQAIKFQKRTPELAVPADQWDIERDTPWGRMSYIDYRRRIELPMSALNELGMYAILSGLDYIVSAWDEQAVKDLTEGNGQIPDALKIPSAKITDLKVVGLTWASTLPVIVSTGMSTDEEIEKVSHFCHAMLHCTSTYPCPPEELNLRNIIRLRGKYTDRVIGYSGHEVGLATTVAAVALGAKIVERHITLDRSMWGTDQAASVEPQGLVKLVKNIRTIETALGDGLKHVYPSELPALKKLRG